MQTVLKNRQLLYLFMANLSILFIGSGLFPLLPYYAVLFGATPTMTGFFFGMIYAVSTAGAMMTGWMSRLLGSKRLFIGAGVLGLPALALLSQAGAFWQVVALTSVLWWIGGVNLSLASVFTSHHADGAHRGAAFSLIMLAFPISAVLGTATTGHLVTAYGYATMFVVLMGVWVLVPVLGFLLRDTDDTAQPTGRTAPSSSRISRVLWLLLSLSALVSLTSSSARLGFSLSMHALGFSAASVSLASTLGGLLAIPVVLATGAASDRLGRRGILAVSVGLVTVSALLLAQATQLWHFSLAATLLMIVLVNTNSLLSALAIDVLSPAALNRALPWIAAAASAASIVSFAATGYVMERWGAEIAYMAVAVLATGTILLAAALPGPALIPNMAWRAKVDRLRVTLHTRHLLRRRPVTR